MKLRLKIYDNFDFTRPDRNWREGRKAAAGSISFLLKNIINKYPSTQTAGKIDIIIIVIEKKKKLKVKKVKIIYKN